MTKKTILVLAIIWLVPGISLFSKMISKALKRRRQQNLLIENEAERLDRIRNPSKYLGR